MTHSRRLVLLSGLTVALLLAGGSSRAEEMLVGMPCVDLLVEDPGADAEEIDLTYDLLYAALKVGVTTRLPRLKIEETCQDSLYLNVTAVKSDSVTGSALAYAASVRLEVRRPARLVEAKSGGMATVWDASSLVAGEAEQAKQTTLDVIEDLTRIFAGVYRDAGNR